MAQSSSRTPTPTPSSSHGSSPIFRLPLSVRQIIYSYLLAPQQEGEVTTVNYTLKWPLLDNPSNTTFAGPVQISLCHCPQLRKSIRTGEHYYTRYRCYGPDVRIHSGKEQLWVLGTPHGQFNILRPASKGEEKKRPNANILQTCKQVYEEAVPTLYRGRNFLFLTGPCPRGRYQAYATQRWLEQLSPLARSNVTHFSLLAQAYEEDCAYDDVPRSYAFLAMYILGYVPGLQTVCLNIWDNNLLDAASEFWVLLKNGVEIQVGRDPRGGSVEQFKDVKDFVAAIEEWRGRRQRLSWERTEELKESADVSQIAGTDDTDQSDTDQSDTEEEPEKSRRLGPSDVPQVDNKLPRRVRSKSKRTPAPKALEIRSPVERASDTDWSHMSPASAVPGRRDKEDEEWELI